MSIKHTLVDLVYKICNISANVTLDLIQKNQYKMQLQQQALNSREQGIVATEYVYGQQLIVSLTTYGKRLYDVYLTIESIMQQTLKPNRIVLWLADDLEKEELPIILKMHMSRGLEVRYCKDVRSYKKLIPSLKQFPDDIIVTVDDDIFYTYDMLENLFRSYQRQPNQVHANRVHRMLIDNDGKLKRYNDWIYESKQADLSLLNFPTGGAGALYPPHVLSEEVLNEAAFMELAPKADDVWFKAMAMLNGVKCQKVQTHDPYLLFNDDVQDVALSISNVDNGGNDTQIQAVFDRYDLYKYLKD